MYVRLKVCNGTRLRLITFEEIESNIFRKEKNQLVMEILCILYNEKHDSQNKLVCAQLKRKEDI